MGRVGLRRESVRSVRIADAFINGYVMTVRNVLQRMIGTALCVLTLGIGLCFWPAESAVAQSEPVGDSAQTMELSNWWLRNAASFDPVPEQFLFHAEADYTFNFQTGNVDGVTHQGKTSLYLRKGRATLSARGLISTQRLSIARGTASISSEQYVAAPKLDYALTKAFGPELGFYWEQNSASFIDQRTLGYVGVDISPSTGSTVIVSVLPAFGYLHEQALLTGETKWFWAPYFEENVTWKISDRVTLHHEGNVLMSIEESDDYRIGMANTLEFPISSIFSLTLNHVIKYNNSPIPTQAAVSALTGGEGKVYKTDNDLTVGVRIQY